MSTPRATLASLLSMIPIVLYTATALADILPPSPCSSTAPNVQPCAGKKVGDACALDGRSGQCQALRCTTDGGETLLACNTSAPPTAPTSSADGGTSSADGGTSTAGGGGCTLGAGSGSTGAGLSVISLVALAWVVRRRRAGARP